MSADYFHSERFVFHLCGFLSIHLPANTNKNHHESDTNLISKSISRCSPNGHIIDSLMG